MLRIGFHISIQGIIDKAIDRALEKKCNTFQIFSRNPRQWQSKKLHYEVVERFKDKLHKSKIWPVFIHTPYLLNLASPKDDVYFKSVKVLKDELIRASELGVPYVVTHLGSHLGYGKMEGFNRISKAVNDSFLSIKNDSISAKKFLKFCFFL